MPKLNIDINEKLPTIANTYGSHVEKLKSAFASNFEMFNNLESELTNYNEITKKLTFPNNSVHNSIFEDSITQQNKLRDLLSSDDEPLKKIYEDLNKTPQVLKSIEIPHFENWQQKQFEATQQLNETLILQTTTLKEQNILLNQINELYTSEFDKNEEARKNNDILTKKTLNTATYTLIISVFALLVTIIFGILALIR